MAVNTSLNDGATGSGEVLELKPDPTWVISAHYDHWLGSGNIGIRARAGFSKPILPWVQGDREIRVYMADLGLLLRPVAPAPLATNPSWLWKWPCRLSGACRTPS